MRAPFPRKKTVEKQPVTCSKDQLPDGRMRVEDVGLDKTERNILQSIRLIATSYASPESQAWEWALDHLYEAFDQVDGPIIAYALTNVMRAMRRSRKSTFRFNNPFCPCCVHEVTAMEKHLMKAVQGARMGHAIVVHTETMMLCEGHSTEALILALDQLVDVLPSRSAPELKGSMEFRVN